MVTPVFFKGLRLITHKRKGVRLMKVWIELKVKDKPTVYLKMQYEKYTICADGSVSNWLETEFAMKGWEITGIGIMFDTICVEVQ